MLSQTYAYCTFSKKNDKIEGNRREFMTDKKKKPQKPDDSHDTMRDGLRQAFKAFALLGSMGIYIVVFIGIGIFFGDLADQYLGLGVKGKLVGIVVSIPGAFYTLFRQLRRSGLL